MNSLEMNTSFNRYSIKPKKSNEFQQNYPIDELTLTTYFLMKIPVVRVYTFWQDFSTEFLIYTRFHISVVFFVAYTLTKTVSGDFFIGHKCFNFTSLLPFSLYCPYIILLSSPIFEQHLYNPESLCSRKILLHFLV